MLLAKLKCFVLDAPQFHIGVILLNVESNWEDLICTSLIASKKILEDNIDDISTCFQAVGLPEAQLENKATESCEIFTSYSKCCNSRSSSLGLGMNVVFHE